MWYGWTMIALFNYYGTPYHAAWANISGAQPYTHLWINFFILEWRCWKVKGSVRSQMETEGGRPNLFLTLPSPTRLTNVTKRGLRGISEKVLYVPDSGTVYLWWIWFVVWICNPAHAGCRYIRYPLSRLCLNRKWREYLPLYISSAG